MYSDKKINVYFLQLLCYSSQVPILLKWKELTLISAIKANPLNDWNNLGIFRFPPASCLRSNMASKHMWAGSEGSVTSERRKREVLIPHSYSLFLSSSFGLSGLSLSAWSLTSTAEGCGWWHHGVFSPWLRRSLVVPPVKSVLPPWDLTTSPHLHKLPPMAGTQCSNGGSSPASALDIPLQDVLGLPSPSMPRETLRC